MSRQTDATADDLVTVTNLHPDDRLKIARFFVPRNTREAILTMQFRISEFVRDLMQGAGPTLASVIGRWRVTTDGFNKPHVSQVFSSILDNNFDVSRFIIGPVSSR